MGRQATIGPARPYVDRDYGSVDLPGLKGLGAINPAPLKRLMRRPRPGYREKYEQLGVIKENPNIDFRVHVYDPLMEEARHLARVYKDDYYGLKQDVFRERYQDPAKEAAEAIALPTPFDFVPAKHPIGLIPSLAPVAGEAISAHIYRDKDLSERTQVAYDMLLRKLEIDLSGRPGYGQDGGEENSVLQGFLLGESRKQRNWDRDIQRMTDGHPERYLQLYRESEPPIQAWVKTTIIPKVGTGEVIQVPSKIKNPRLSTPDGLRPKAPIPQLSSPHAPPQSSLRPKPTSPQPGSLRWMAQGLDKPSPIGSQSSLRPKPTSPRPGSLQWMGQGLDKPSPIGSQSSLRPKPTSPRPGSLQWMGQGLDKPFSIGSQSSLRPKQTSPPSQLQLLDRELRKHF
jgi:hypothetical protein